MVSFFKPWLASSKDSISPEDRLGLHLKVSNPPRGVILKQPCMWVLHLGLIFHLNLQYPHSYLYLPTRIFGFNCNTCMDTYLYWLEFWGLIAIPYRNPTLRQVWRWDSHSQKWELGVLRDSQNFKARWQGSKHLALRCFSYRWKGLKVLMSKMALHEPFRHLQHKLWSKEGLGVKLAVWLPTTKSWKSTRP
jgi:hypothetical protein